MALKPKNIIALERIPLDVISSLPVKEIAHIFQIPAPQVSSLLSQRFGIQFSTKTKKIILDETIDKEEFSDENIDNAWINNPNRHYYMNITKKQTENNNN